jgi:hypothetical protein
MGISATVAASGLLLAPSASGASPAPKKVQAKNFRFCGYNANFCKPTQTRYTLTVPRATRVTWYYKDTTCDRISGCPGHNVVFTSASGPVIKQEGAVLLTLVFNTPGTFAYYCVVHKQLGMTGRVIVT